MPKILGTTAIPVGTVKSYSGSSAPSGFLLCHGQTLNAVLNPQYLNLFNIIGTTYGGTGMNNFIVPDLRGRAPFGKDDMGGSAANRITSAISGINGTSLNGSGGDQRTHGHSHDKGTYSIPSGGSHRHLFQYQFGPGGQNALTLASGVTRQQATGTEIDTEIHSHPNSEFSGNSGTFGSGASQNMPPTLILNYIIKI